MTDTTTPNASWRALVAGNARFAAGGAVRPNAEPARVAALVAGQAPFAAVLGCSDSRVPMELVLDQGVGDLFTVRNAGQIASPDAVASLEFAIAVLRVRLVLVLAHTSCGAVAAGIAAEGVDPPPLPARIRQLVWPIRASIRALPEAQRGDPAAAGRRHLEDTVAALLRESEIASDAVAAGTLGLVGATYDLSSARITPLVAIGVDLDPDHDIDLDTERTP